MHSRTAAGIHRGAVAVTGYALLGTLMAASLLGAGSRLFTGVGEGPMRGLIVAVSIGSVAFLGAGLVACWTWRRMGTDEDAVSQEFKTSHYRFAGRGAMVPLSYARNDRLDPVRNGTAETAWLVSAFQREPGEARVN